MTIKALIIDYLGICNSAWYSGLHQLTPDRSKGALTAVLHHPAAGLSGTQHASGLVQCRLGAVHCSYSVTNNSTSMFYLLSSTQIESSFCHSNNHFCLFQRKCITTWSECLKRSWFCVFCCTPWCCVEDSTSPSAGSSMITTELSNKAEDECLNYYFGLGLEHQQYVGFKR